MIPINEDAKRLVQESVEPGLRILIRGGTGWFGRTMLSLLRGLSTELVVTARRARSFSVNGNQYQATTWSLELLEQFKPELVIDCAFNTVGSSSIVDLNQFVEENNRMLRETEAIVSVPSVRRLLTFSSGATRSDAVTDGHDERWRIYRDQKKSLEEIIQRENRRKDFAVAIARVWSVSGGHVRDSWAYALSGMVASGIDTGSVTVASPRRVLRRYCAVEEVLAVAIWRIIGGRSFVFDTGGVEVEIRELAKLVAQCLGLGADAIFYPETTELAPDSYLSNSNDWLDLTSKAGLKTLDLEEQVRNVIQGLSVAR